MLPRPAKPCPVPIISMIPGHLLYHLWSVLCVCSINISIIPDISSMPFDCGHSTDYKVEYLACSVAVVMDICYSFRRCGSSRYGVGFNQSFSTQHEE